MATRLPMATLLSQALTAFTIETDNEAEHRMPPGLRTPEKIRVNPAAIPC